MVSDGNASLQFVSPRPFLAKVYEIIEEPSIDHIISWSSTCDSFVVHNINDLSKEILPKYFKHQNFSSFIRQLNTYGFKKVQTNQWTFAHPLFRRGMHTRTMGEIRRKPRKQGSSSLQVKKDARPAPSADENQTALLNLLQRLQEQVASLQNEVCELKVEKDCLKESLASHEQVSRLYQQVLDQQRTAGRVQQSNQHMYASQMHRPHLAGAVPGTEPDLVPRAPISMPMTAVTVSSSHAMQMNSATEAKPPYVTEAFAGVQSYSSPPLSQDTPLHLSLLQDLISTSLQSGVNGWCDRHYTHTNQGHQPGNALSNTPSRSNSLDTDTTHCTQELDDPTVDFLWDTLLREQNIPNAVALVA